MWMRISISLIFAKLKRWSDAEFHFGKALSLRAKAPWILQGFGAAKIRNGKVAEGEELLLEAERANPKHSPTLVELGRLRESQGNVTEAENYLRRAIEAEPNNSYAYYRLSKLLYREGSIEEAYEMAKAALITNPLNARNKMLLQELKTRIAETSATKQHPVAVQIRCVEQTKQTGAHERIQSLGGINRDGKRWKVSVNDAISYIENGKYVFFIERPADDRVEVVVAQNSAGHKYLKAASDKEQPESLLVMPACKRLGRSFDRGLKIRNTLGRVRPGHFPKRRAGSTGRCNTI
jgi:tetratricopeptide (TPR) repeat protein